MANIFSFCDDLFRGGDTGVCSWCYLERDVFVLNIDATLVLSPPKGCHRSPQNVIFWSEQSHVFTVGSHLGVLISGYLVIGSGTTCSGSM